MSTLLNFSRHGILGDIAEESARSRGGLGGGLGSLDVGAGELPTPAPTDNIWIRVGAVNPANLGGDVGAAAYAWQFVNRTELALSISAEKVGSISRLPAFEMNNFSNVPSGSVVRAWYGTSSGRPALEFVYDQSDCCVGSGGGGSCPSYAFWYWGNPTHLSNNQWDYYVIPGTATNCCGNCCWMWMDAGDCHGWIEATLGHTIPGSLNYQLGGGRIFPTTNPLPAPPAPPNCGCDAGAPFSPYANCCTPGSGGTGGGTGGGGGPVPCQPCNPVTDFPCYKCLSGQFCSNWEACFGGGGGLQQRSAGGMPSSSMSAGILGGPLGGTLGQSSTGMAGDCGCGGSCDCGGSCGGNPVANALPTALATSRFGMALGGGLDGTRPVSIDIENITATGTTGAVLVLDGSGGVTTSAGSFPSWLTYGTVTPTALSAQADNYAPGNAKFLRVSATLGSDQNITGLSMSQVDGQEVIIKNVGATQNVKLKMENGSSSAANQFSNAPSAGDDVIAPGGVVRYVYTSATNFWTKIG